MHHFQGSLTPKASNLFLKTTNIWRFAEFKGMITSRVRWRVFDAVWSYFETPWKPKSWDSRYRFVFVRQKVRVQRKEPVQLDLFIPQESGFEFSVIVTNKETTMKKVVVLHHGRGSQENIIGQMKSQARMDYIPVRRLNGNHLYLMSAVLSHNFCRELQMMTPAKTRGTTEKRTQLWAFQGLDMLRKLIFQRAGRLTRPEGVLTLTMSDNEAVKRDITHMLDALQRAAR